MNTPTPPDARCVDDLWLGVQAGARPTYLFFWSHRPRVPGRVDAACLSQWWPVRFRVDGHDFASAEQYMMWRKATLFDDEQAAQHILDARSPAHAKDLGRLVRGFDEDEWGAARWDNVVHASVAKFSADADLRAFLVGTRQRVLVEASPVDRIWGIGLPADSPDADRPERWRGLNLLGFALMEARSRLG